MNRKNDNQKRRIMERYMKKNQEDLSTRNYDRGKKEKKQ